MSTQKKVVNDSEGRGIVHCKIISELDSFGSTREYCVKVTRIGDENVSLRATLSLASDVSLSPYDEVYGVAILEEETDVSALSDGRILYLCMEEMDKCYVRYTSEGQSFWSLIFTDVGIEILSDSISNNISYVLRDTLGDEIGPLASGFFMGNKEGISSIVKRDFRRSGTSHLMAVSGLHMSILLGSVELVLRKLRVAKVIRCITVILLGAMFLFAAGFAPSACRSYLMLTILYLSFFIYEENDGVTSLFVSVVIIFLFFPYAVVDIGLWLSVFATLGLLTAYPVLENKIPYPKKSRGICKRILLILREICLMALTSFVANMFVLPLLWLFFGEFSVISVFANIVLSYVSTVFMVAIPIYLAVFKLPLIGAFSSWLICVIGRVILSVVSYCSRLDFAVVSLRHTFCAVIIVLFSISTLILLCVELKHKCFVGLPMILAVISFFICFAVNDVFLSKPVLTYINDDRSSEIICVNNGGEITFCDNSAGSVNLVYRIKSEMDICAATEIENYILLHYHDGHVSLVDKLTSENVVKRLLLPKPISDNDIEICNSLIGIAQNNGVPIEFYGESSIIDIVDEVALCVTSPSGEENGVEMLFATKDKKVFYTTSGRYSPSEIYSLAIIGKHDAVTDHSYFGLNADRILIGAAESSRNMFDDDANLYLPSRYGYVNKIYFRLA